MLDILRGGFSSLVLKILGAILTLGFNILLARTLGAKEAGIYYIALTCATIASMFSRAGFDNVLLRFIAANAIEKNWARVKGIYEKIIKISLILSILITLFLLGSAHAISSIIFKKIELEEPIKLIAFSITPMVIAILHAQGLKGLKYIGASQVIESTGIPLISIIGLYFWAHDYGIQGAILSYNLATLLIAILGVCIWKKITPQLLGIKGRFNIGKIISTSIPLFWVDVMGLILNWSGTVSLGIWGKSSDVGIFNAASRASLLISFILIAATPAIAPKLAELYRIGDLSSLKNVVKKTADITTILAIPVVIFFIFQSSLIMSLFGTEYMSGKSVLIILSLGQFINVATGSVSFLLIMSGKEFLVRDSMILGGIINIVCNLVLVPNFGIIGAALATSISFAIQNLYAVFLVWKHLKIKTYPFL
jgi:O-antigen/teichoic acid export membrane protein